MLSVVTSIYLIVGSDKFGRRGLVLIATVVCSVCMLIVGILGQVARSSALDNFLIFIACVWSVFNPFCRSFS